MIIYFIIGGAAALIILFFVIAAWQVKKDMKKGISRDQFKNDHRL